MPGDVWLHVKDLAGLVIGFSGSLGYYLHARLESQQQRYQAEREMQQLDALRKSHESAMACLRETLEWQQQTIARLEERLGAAESRGWNGGRRGRT